MNRFLLLFSLITLGLLPSGFVAAEVQRPNIILVMPDDSGYGDYACLGNPLIQTPSVDAFKQESLLLTRFHVSPTCAPARGALMSGRHEFKNGITHTIGGRERMAPSTVTMPQVLQSASYTTGIFGKWHLGDEEAYRPESRGFDEVYIHGSGGIGQSGDAPGNNNINPTLLHNGTFVRTNGYCTDLFFDQALRWMDAKRKADKPFFAYIATNAPHAPHVLPKENYEHYLGKPRVHEERAKFFGMIENIDTNFGKVLKHLDDWGIADNTLVIYLGTDNGGTAGRNFYNAGLRGGKASPYQGGTRAPCFVRWPAGGVPAAGAGGVESDALASHIDLFPTLASIAGVEFAPDLEKQVEGRSLLPLLKNPDADWPSRTLVHHVGRWPKGQSSDFKHTKYAIQNENFTLVNNEELYDLNSDPGEANNVIDEHPEVVAALRSEYDKWWADVQPYFVNEDTSGFSHYSFRDLYTQQFGKEATAQALERGRQFKAEQAKPDATPETDNKDREQRLKLREERKKKRQTTVPTSTTQQVAKPNIVVVLADDMGWGDCATFGHPLIKTPNLDKLASQGVKLTQCYSAAGVCSPSRSAILTGRTPYRNGVYRHLSGNHEAHLRESEIAYPKLLKTIGYETCHVGKWHLNSKSQFNNDQFPQPGDHGYDYWFATHNNASPSHKQPDNFVRNGEPVGVLPGYSAPEVAKEAAHWLAEVRDQSKPFTLSVWFHEPHSPIATDSRFSNMYDGHKNSKYMGNISQLDFALGEIMKALDEQGVSDNTLIIFTSDNGPVPGFGGTTGGLRGAKRSDHEGGIRVPGVVRWPGQIEPGTTSDVPVIGTDIFATVLDITGLPMPKDRTIDGVSMLPAFAGEEVDRQVPLFWRTHVSKPADRVAMRVGDWKLVGNDTLTKFQLYHIQEDWKEEKDLADEMPEKTEAMKQQLLDLWKSIEEEGPDEWWKNDRQRPKGGGTLSY